MKLFIWFYVVVNIDEVILCLVNRIYSFEGRVLMNLYDNGSTPLE